MLRRSFRIGILVGLLGGAVVALVRAVAGDRGSDPASVTASQPAWTPIPDAEPLRVPTPAAAPPPPPPPPPPAPAPEPAPIPAAAPAPAPKADTSALAALQEEPPAAKKKAAPAKKAAAPKPKKAAEPWVQPVDGDCPATHPVKGKLSSKIFHVPGGFNYARTQPDRCYIDAAAAEADGLRQSKR